MFLFFGVGRWLGTRYQNIGRPVDLSPCWRNVCVHFISRHGEFITFGATAQTSRMSHISGKNARDFLEFVSKGGAGNFFPCISNSIETCAVFKVSENVFF